jgi:uncharacterized protein
VVGPFSEVLASTTIYPHCSRAGRDSAVQMLMQCLGQFPIEIVGLGNGIGSQPTEKFLFDSVLPAFPRVSYTVVSENGASYYSVTPAAEAEMPFLSPNHRSAVSLARRLQDPLAELVKMAPQHLGVGMYQHSLNEQRLAAVFSRLTEDCIADVGLDLNTASAAILAHVAGIGPVRAAAIVAHRDEHGPFPNRRALLQVKGIGPGLVRLFGVCLLQCGCGCGWMCTCVCWVRLFLWGCFQTLAHACGFITTHTYLHKTHCSTV